jgi:antitoxin ParD1/3/4
MQWQADDFCHMMPIIVFVIAEAAMASMNISVPDPMRDWVERRIVAGQYASVSDYVRDLIRRDQAQFATDHDDLRRKIAAGLASLRAGNMVDGEAFLATLDAELAKQERQGR